VGTREKTGIGRKERKAGTKCVMRRERQFEHMWNGCNEMRKEERGEILNEDGREIR
jgi:hypothetical protein